MNNSVKRDFASVNVLVVEDNMVNQLLVKSVLKKFGFTRIDAAENGKSALEKLDSNVYDLILMDIQMPGMDGYQITKAIRASQNDLIKNIPVIALTGDASDKEKAKAKEAGMNDYVSKPYSPEDLLKAITTHLPSENGKAVNNSQDIPDAPAVGMSLSFLVKFTGGDQELTMQLIEIFLQQVPDAVDRIGQLIPEKKWSEIFPIAHKIKSSFAIFELEDAKNLILAIEEYSRDQVKLEVIPKLFEDFKTASEKAVANLQHELQKLKSLHA